VELSLKDRRVLITGGSSGIGRGIALAATRAGARIGFNYHSDPAGAEESQRQIEAAGGQAVYRKADVSDPSDVAALFTMMDEAWGGVDVLVNNAGIDGVRAKVWEGEAADWKKVIDVNLMGTYYGIKEATARMVPRGSGVIVNISSVHETIPWGGHSAYCAAKAGIGIMVRSLALELADSGVRILSLAPGAIKTEINEDVWSDPAQLKDLKKKMPVNRMGTVEEIGNVAVMLMSDASSYITGTTLYVDGGMTCYPSFAAGG